MKPQNANPNARLIPSTIPPPPGLLGLPPGWERVEKEDGTVYYWNVKTQEVTWTNPAAPSPGAPAPIPQPVPPVDRFNPASVTRRNSKLNTIPGAPSNLDPESEARLRQFQQDRYGTVQGVQRNLGGLDAAIRAPGAAFPPPPTNAFPPPPGAPPPGVVMGQPPSGLPPAPAVKAPTAAASGAPPVSQHRFRAMPHLARNMGLVASTVQVWIGLIILSSNTYRAGVTIVCDPPLGPCADGQPQTLEWSSPYGLGMGFWCLVGGSAMLYFEYWTFARPVVQVAPFLWKVRLGAYLILGVPGFLTAYPTDSNSSLMPPILGSVYYMIVAGITAISAFFARTPTAKEWAWPWFTSDAQKKKLVEEGGKVSSFEELLTTIPKQAISLFEKGMLPRLIFLTWYSMLNIVLGLEAYNRHKNSVLGKALRGVEPANELLQKVGAGQWFPFAKLFGQLLNLNCTVMVLPVVRGLVMRLHNITSFKGTPWFLKWIPFVLPLDKNVVFHKACAKYFIFVSVFGHATAHYMNYQYAPYYEQALGAAIYNRSPTKMAWLPGAPDRNKLGIAAGFTGEVLMTVMLIIYCGANDQVKRSHYETFWYSHHFFIVWFVFLLIHGPVWKYWCLLALPAYIVDRLLRVFYRGRTPIPLANVFFWGSKPDKPDVLTLQFDNAVQGDGRKHVEYMEGHYLYLRCPSVEGPLSWLLKEWHPFTISSAPDESVLEVNIRIMPSPFSWTNKVAKYLAMLDPQGTGHIQLTTRNPTTGAITCGKTLGPDGLPFFQVDAPHGAPSQHVFSYNTAIIVGAGIGVTPCSSIMKGVVNYRWKKGYTPNNLHFFWVARLTDLTTFKWLLVQLPELKAQELVHNDFYGGDKDRRQALIKQLEGARKQLKELNADSKGEIAAPPALPPGWAESRTAKGDQYYYNTMTGETSWAPPGLKEATAGSGGTKEQLELQVAQLQAAVREASTNNRTLSITIYLTGCKPGDLKPKPDAKPGSNEELIAALQSTTDPNTGEPYLIIKAGRPDWPGEFADLADRYGREDIGVIFCGAPAIAAALKESCEKYSDREKTIFRLHKENF
eukprot:CAMPEP_0119303326 /NCGR_PEP_ID=MMETSP1333-20130426/4778_1 /TAXON_ID=418940 /ORGANISM="Scyphosphaera apsteinii, Strain RCC1455" /LENGTH=1066 /DNA_ID=CAMNT_0007305975 /DNA_START=248 /DNA_END=3448 /DNA_ORIENTATION=-